MNHDFKNVSESTRRRNPHLFGPAPQGPERKRDPENALPGAGQGTEKGPALFVGRPQLRIVSYRVRLTDKDNLHCKAFTDALRYAAIIADDSEKALEILPPEQVKVAHKEEERTFIHIEGLTALED